MPKVTLELKGCWVAASSRGCSSHLQVVRKDELDLEDIVMMCGGILVETGRKDSAIRTRIRCSR